MAGGRWLRLLIYRRDRDTILAISDLLPDCVGVSRSFAATVRHLLLLRRYYRIITHNQQLCP